MRSRAFVDIIKQRQGSVAAGADDVSYETADGHHTTTKLPASEAESVVARCAAIWAASRVGVTPSGWACMASRMSVQVMSCGGATKGSLRFLTTTATASVPAFPVAPPHPHLTRSMPILAYSITRLLADALVHDHLHTFQPALEHMQLPPQICKATS